MHACLYPQEGELCSYDTQPGRKAVLPFLAMPKDPEVQGITIPREASG